MDVGSYVHPLWPMQRVTAPPVVQDVFTSSPITDPILEIPQVSISYFENTLLPPLHTGLDTDAVLSELKKSGAIDGARWQLLLHESPSPEAFSDNNHTIKSFNAIAAEVAACARQILAKSQVQWRQTVEFLDAFTKPMPFHANKVALTADGYALLVQPLAPRRSVPHWDDIVVAGIKIYAPKEDTFDVNFRMEKCMAHAMAETVQRRFMFGYTLEGSSMRLWFCSRGDLLVSQPFNWTEDHRTLVHFFLSVMFAARPQLGYDPTIRQAVHPEDASKRSYDITVRSVDEDGRPHNTVFRTIEVVADIGVETLIGKGTRVWRAIQLDSEGKPTGNPVVLKDSWVDADSNREGDTLKALMNTAIASGDPAHVETLNKHFLHCLHYGDVYVDGQPDNTCALIRRGVPIPEGLKPFTLTRPKPPLTEFEKYMIPSIEHRFLEFRHRVPLRGAIRCHSRMVFEEFGISIEDLTSVVDITIALMQTLQGLKTMHELGWIHRDISSCNVIVVNGHVKIIDLECARRQDDDNRSGSVHVGTKYFVAGEVEGQYHMFFPHVGRQLTPTFTPNVLHDLESFWWLSVYLIIPRATATEPDEPRDQDKEAKLHSTVWKMFAGDRKRYFDRKFTDVIQHMRTSLQPAAYSLNLMRKLLVWAYVSVEADHEKGINMAAAGPIHDELIAACSQLLDHISASGDIVLSPFHTTSVRTSKSLYVPAQLSLDSRVSYLDVRQQMRYSASGRRDVNDNDMHVI
ncbi:hypothetical protein BDW22DRAFT_1397290 [Trametopsis cervina]|nr:hypothetical protein BDW22DRAFT_1397290 [Trametopsis cervina]